MTIKGIDNGYLYTKDNEKRIFKSAFTKEDSGIKGSNSLSIDGINYCVGVGSTNVDTNKIDSEMNMAGTLLNLCLSGKGEYCIVAGLPISQYSTLKDEFALQIMSYNMSKVFYMGEEYKVQIKDCLIMPQGASALLALNSLKDGEYILIDVGGLTIDAICVEVSSGSIIPQQKNTWFNGVQKLYSNIIFEVNARYNLTLSPSYAEKILKSGLIVDGILQDTGFVEKIKEEYLSEIIKELKLNYPVRTTNVFVCGGGGIVLFDTIKNSFKNAELLRDSQFLNAIGYYKAGLKKFKKYIQVPQPLDWRSIK